MFMDVRAALRNPPMDGVAFGWGLQDLHGLDRRKLRVDFRSPLALKSWWYRKQA